MKLAFISDIHANLEALTAALADIRARGIEQIFCLGDTINYGANPNECLKLLRKSVREMIQGNHEAALVLDSVLEHFNPEARAAMLWTRTQVPDKDRQELSHLSYTYTRGDWMMVHGTIEAPYTFEYLYDPADALRNFRYLKVPICFFGHTHVPTLFSEKKYGALMLRAGKVPLSREDRYFINVSSVGQPRDGDPRLGYLVFDDEAFEIELVRLPYDTASAARKILAAGLPPFLAERLGAGV